MHCLAGLLVLPRRKHNSPYNHGKSDEKIYEKGGQGPQESHEEIDEEEVNHHSCEGK